MDTDFISIIVDEVSLEGLDGLTLQGLWVRLKTRPHFGMSIDEKSKVYLWKCLLRIKEFDFYELPEARGNLVVENRLECVDPESGTVVDYENETILYPVKIINDEKIKGSCTTFHSRQEITEDIRNDKYESILSLEEVENKYGNRLVIVASQKQRNMTLLGSDLDPSCQLSDMPYCLLERIGRGRYNGELSRGTGSLQIFDLQPKTMFYFTLILIRNGLVKKQSVSVSDVNGKNSLRGLFHLTRFFSPFQSKYSILTSLVTKYLSERPGKRQELFQTRRDCEIDQKSFKKLYQGNKTFKVYSVLYREVYPNATEEEYTYKKNKEEKTIRVIELSETSQESDEDEEEDEDEKVTKDVPRFNYLYEKSLLESSVMALDEAGPEGLSRGEFTLKMNLDYYDGRLLVRSLERKNLAAVVMAERGKQKEKMYISKKWQNQSRACNEYNSEMTKLKSNLAKESEQEKSKDYSKKSPNEASIPMEMETKETSASVLEDVNVNSQSVQVDDKTEEDHHSCFLTGKSETGKEFLSTGRHLKRLNWILEAIKENKIFDNEYSILRIIREKEKKEGFKWVFDKKSLLRLLNILIKDKKIRSIKTVITAGQKMKELHYITDMSIQPSDPILHSLIAQAKLKFTSVQKEHLQNCGLYDKFSPSKIKLPANLPESAKDSIIKLQQYKSRLKASDMVYDNTASKYYGNRPKYQKAKVVHQILWHLIYGMGRKNPGDDEPSKDKKPDSATEASTDKTPANCADNQASLQRNAGDSGSQEEVENWKDLNDEQLAKAIDDLKDLPVYTDEYNWKRYLSPLPAHYGFGEGWCLISDVLLKLPLGIFCNVVPINYRIRGLKELLDHPLKSHYPVISLPVKISQQLLFARKYIFSFFETCSVLCTMGLLTLGPQVMKERDKTFIYLHKRTSLFDTANADGIQVMSSTLGDVDKRDYVFDCQESLDHYWHDLQHLALHSNMGVKSYDRKDDDNDGPGSLGEALRIKAVDEIVDDGSIPGNKKGVGGMDSSLYIHVTRSWSTGKTEPTYIDRYIKPKDAAAKRCREVAALNLESKKEKVANIRLSSILPKERLTLLYNDKKPEVVKVTMTNDTKGNKGGKGVKRKAKDTEYKPKKRKIQGNKKDPSRKPKPKIRKRVYDETDEIAYERKSSLRVRWTPREDSLLLTCKIGSLIMDKKRRGVLVPWSTIRDVLHKYATQESRDKTSCACQRRVAHSLKNPTTKHNMMIFFSEAMQDEQIKKFSEETYLQSTESTINSFLELVDLLITKFSEVKLKNSILPSSLSEISSYTINPITQTYKKVPMFMEVKNRSDILQGVLHSIFHSNVSCKDKQGRSHEMFLVLKQYPDSALDKTLYKMRSDQLLVRQKKKNDTKRSSIEICLKHVKLSQRYEYRFHSRYPSSIFANTTDCFDTLWQQYLDSNGGKKSKLTNFADGGVCASLIAFLILGKIAFRVVMPKDVVILDPTSTRLGRGYYKNILEGKFPLPNDDDDEVEDDEDDDLIPIIPPENDDADTPTCTSSKLSVNCDKKVSAAAGDADMKQDAVKETTGATIQSTSPFDSSIGKSQLNIETCDQKFRKCTQDLDGTGMRNMLEFHSSNKSILNLPDDEEQSESDMYAKARSTDASRALLTMRRSCAERQINLRHFNIQDNFVIDACAIYVGLIPPQDQTLQGSRLVVEEADGLGPMKQGKEGEIIQGQERDTMQEVPVDSTGDHNQTLMSEVFIDKEKIKNVMQRLQKFLPFQIDLESVWNSIESSLLPLVQKIYKKIDDSGELGIRKMDVKDHFRTYPGFSNGIRILLEKDVKYRSDEALVYRC